MQQRSKPERNALKAICRGCEFFKPGPRCTRLGFPCLPKTITLLGFGKCPIGKHDEHLRIDSERRLLGLPPQDAPDDEDDDD